MADEQTDPEVIRRQMEAQRASLAEKLETLENKIVRTVDEAREAVAETVQTVKDSVQSSVETVKDTVSSSVETVKETFDVRLQVQRHPWAMFGSSIALGFAAGWALNRALGSGRGASASLGYSSGGSYPGKTGFGSVTPRSQGGYREEARAAATFTGASPTAAHHETSPPPAPAPRGPSWIDELAQTFAPELHKLKGVAIGAAMSVARDFLTQSVPEQLRPQLDEVINNVTSKLGGEPMRGHLLDELRERFQERHNGEHHAPELEPQA
jgi:ElaB/YqjD/DUF883 family membrane-anchored ribosome-binding protein